MEWSATDPGRVQAGQLRALQANLARVEEQLQRALVREKQLRDTLEASQSQTTQRAQIDFLKRENDSLLEKLAISSPRGELESSRRHQQDRINGLESANAAIQRELIETLNSLETQRRANQKLDATIDDITKKLESTLDELEHTEAAKAAVQTELQHARRFLKEKQQAIEVIEARSSDLSRKLQAAQDELRIAQNTQNDLRNDNQELANKLAELQKLCDVQNKALSESTAAVNASSVDWQRQSEDYEQEIKALQDEIANRRSLNREQQAKIEQMTRELAQAEMQLSATLKENDGMKEAQVKKVKEFDTIARSLQSNMQEIASRDKSWEAEAIFNQQKYEETRVEMEVLQARYAALQVRLEMDHSKYNELMEGYVPGHIVDELRNTINQERERYEDDIKELTQLLKRAEYEIESRKLIAIHRANKRIASLQSLKQQMDTTDTSFLHMQQTITMSQTDAMWSSHLQTKRMEESLQQSESQKQALATDIVASVQGLQSRFAFEIEREKEIVRRLQRDLKGISIPISSMEEAITHCEQLITSLRLLFECAQLKQMSLQHVRRVALSRTSRLERAPKMTEVLIPTSPGLHKLAKEIEKGEKSDLDAHINELQGNVAQVLITNQALHKEMDGLRKLLSEKHSELLGMHSLLASSNEKGAWMQLELLRLQTELDGYLSAAALKGIGSEQTSSVDALEKEQQNQELAKLKEQVATLSAKNEELNARLHAEVNTSRKEDPSANVDPSKNILRSCHDLRPCKDAEVQFDYDKSSEFRSLLEISEKQIEALVQQLTEARLKLQEQQHHIAQLSSLGSSSMAKEVADERLVEMQNELSSQYESQIKELRAAHEKAMQAAKAHYETEILCRDRILDEQTEQSANEVFKMSMDVAACMSSAASATEGCVHLQDVLAGCDETLARERLDADGHIARITVDYEARIAAAERRARDHQALAAREAAEREGTLWLRCGVLQMELDELRRGTAAAAAAAAGRDPRRLSPDGHNACCAGHDRLQENERNRRFDAAPPALQTGPRSRHGSLATSDLQVDYSTITPASVNHRSQGGGGVSSSEGGGGNRPANRLTTSRSQLIHSTGTHGGQLIYSTGTDAGVKRSSQGEGSAAARAGRRRSQEREEEEEYVNTPSAVGRQHLRRMSATDSGGGHSPMSHSNVAPVNDFSQGGSSGGALFNSSTRAQGTRKEDFLV